MCWHQFDSLFGESPLSRRLQQPSTHFRRSVSATTTAKQKHASVTTKGEKGHSSGASNGASWLVHGEQGSSVPSMGWEESFRSHNGDETQITCTRVTSTTCRGRPEGREGQCCATPASKQRQRDDGGQRQQDKGGSGRWTSSRHSSTS